MILWILFGSTAFLYFLLIFLLIIGYLKNPSIKDFDCDSKVNISIILPFHNEEKNLDRCLLSILNQQSTNASFEVIAVNDHSSDSSVSIVGQFVSQCFPISLVHTQQKGKKQALLAGVNQAKGELIITVDADCIYPSGWLQTMAAYYHKYQPVMMIGPVKIAPVKSWFHQFQFVDLMSLSGSGAGAAGLAHPILCNGANLAFLKSVFQSLDNPLNLDYLSGDDVFLLHKIKKAFPNRILFVNHPSAVAETKPAGSLINFFKQRSRWASKTPGYTDKDSLVVAALVGSTSILTALGWMFSFFSLNLIFAWLILYLVKLFVDGLFLFQLSALFGNRNKLLWLPVFSFLFTFYVTAVICAYPFQAWNKKWK
jgi:poly-beta-1,6-N-acetyl-D-glucosamine synthase